MFGVFGLALGVEALGFRVGGLGAWGLGFTGLRVLSSPYQEI